MQLLRESQKTQRRIFPTDKTPPLLSFTLTTTVHQLRQHLDYLYLQVLSVVTVSQLQNIFAKRSNFDLRQLISGTCHRFPTPGRLERETVQTQLGLTHTPIHTCATRIASTGTEPFFDSLVSTLQTSLAVALSSISVYRLPPTLRSDLARALDPGKETIRSLDLLYVLLLAEGRLVTLLRPKKHSIHPTDLHLLLETVYAPRRTSSSSDETESGPPGGDEDDEDEAGQTGEAARTLTNDNNDQNRDHDHDRDRDADRLPCSNRAPNRGSRSACLVSTPEGSCTPTSRSSKPLPPLPRPRRWDSNQELEGKEGEGEEEREGRRRKTGSGW